MIRWRTGDVVGLTAEWAGGLELRVVVDGRELAALAYPALVGRPQPGDRVLLNTAALELGLGTGGFALVVAVPDRLPPDQPAPGHLVKARYTPLQVSVLGVDEPDSPDADALAGCPDLGGLPVVLADLHSALPAVLAGLYAQQPGARAAYVMTDSGALPAALSRSVAGLRAAGWLVGTVSTGQAYGGDLDAVTVHSGLLAARAVLDADVVIVAQGPGNLGTGTTWGFSGVAVGEAINATATLGGRPVATLRVSQVDPRARHRGVSHHSLTAYGRVALAPAEVVVPQLPGEFGAQVVRQTAVLAGRHRLVEVPTDGLVEALTDCPVPLSTMGRSLADDPAYFLAAAAGGRYAGQLLPDPLTSRR